MEEGISGGSSHELSLEDEEGMRAVAGHGGRLSPGVKAPGRGLDVGASPSALLPVF